MPIPRKVPGVLELKETNLHCPIHRWGWVCCAQLLWMRQTLRDFGYNLSNSLLCDNESAIRMADNPVEHSRTKHIDIWHHFLRDHRQKGDIDIYHISTENQLADIFTKLLDEKTFCRLRSELNVLDLRNLDWSIAYMCSMPLIMFFYAYCCLFMVLKLYTWSPNLTSSFASDALI